MEQQETVNESIYNILKTEHKEVKKLFNEILEKKEWNRSVWNQIDSDLKTHMTGEEKYVYPRLEKSKETRETTLEAIEEHKAAKQVQAAMMDVSGEERIARCKVLFEMIEHHIEEEENTLFKESKKVLTKNDEMEIATQFTKYKQTQKAT
jgi:hypothetical protein